MRILLTTTSFQDTPGSHHDLLAAQGFEIVRERGPLPEARMLELAGPFDGFLCGDDAITRAVLEKSLPRLKVVSKYGIGLDKVDVKAATELGVPVTFCPGVNHTTVAEHTYGLLFAVARRIVEECNHVRSGSWKRLTGHEVMGKTLGVIGMGRIGKEVVRRAGPFGLEVGGYDVFWDEAFAAEHRVRRFATIDDLIRASDIVSLHASLSPETRHLIDARRIALFRPDAILLNCARGELVETAALAEALDAGRLQGYGADVLDQEPPPADHPLLRCARAVLTPHIGSRTHESVQRQATMAVENLVAVLAGKKPPAQANAV